MTTANGQLGHRLAALRADFADLGTRAAGTARSMAATLPPPTALLDELTAAGKAFEVLRTAIMEQARALSLVVDADGLGSLRDLEPVLAAITAAEEQRARVAAWEQMRTGACAVLDRVVALVYRDDKELPALGEIQERARTLRAALAGPAPDALEAETARLPEQTRPFAELLALVDGWNVLDDERCALLQDAIAESFGRPLAVAALRGKLGRAGETPSSTAAPRKRARPAAAPTRSASVTPVDAPLAPTAAPEPAAPAGSESPKVATSAGRRTRDAAPGVAPPAESESASVSPTDEDRRVAEAAPPPVATEAETSTEASPAPSTDGEAGGEDELERLAQESARWWIAARNGWNGLRERGLTFGDAAHDYLRRFPYLLAVPLQKSAAYDGGRLAEGYSLLLDHIEKQEPGFVTNALTRLSPQFARHSPEEAYPLEQELYLYVVAEGRLYKTYPDFVREVMLHAVPQPGAWVQGGIVDSDDETRLFIRSETPGRTEEQTRTLTERQDRLGPHLFRVTLGPLTTRFFTLRAAGDGLADPPNVEIKLTENEAPTDHAWIVTLRAPGSGSPGAPRKHRPGGTTLEELGHQFGGFWMGVFNADPHNDRRYELSVILRRKPPPLPPDPKPGAKPAAEHFFGKNR